MAMFVGDGVCEEDPPSDPCPPGHTLGFFPGPSLNRRASLRAWACWGGGCSHGQLLQMRSMRGLLSSHCTLSGPLGVSVCGAGGPESAL